MLLEYLYKRGCLLSSQIIVFAVQATEAPAKHKDGLLEALGNKKAATSG
jgi:hypothetical protein